MRRFFLWTLTISCLYATAGPAASAQSDVALSSVARTAHLEYSWLGSQAVQLSGFGIVLVFRPGENLYEVNDRIESSAIAPRYAANNELYVSQALGDRIVSLSHQAQQRLAAAERAMQAAEAAQVANAMALTGAISLTVEQLKGAEAVLINGSAPPAAPVLITMLGLLSSDLPNVLLSRHDVQAGPDGKFQAILPIGPDYVRGSYVRVLATSLPGVTSASAQILIDPANAGLMVPFEQQPGGIW